MTPRPIQQLLRSLGKLARGLSALFWGLPAALLVSAETARADWLKPLGLLPLLAIYALLLYGLWQMGEFQKQERPWRLALDRALLVPWSTSAFALSFTGTTGCRGNIFRLRRAAFWNSPRCCSCST